MAIIITEMPPLPPLMMHYKIVVGSNRTKSGRHQKHRFQWYLELEAKQRKMLPQLTILTQRVAMEVASLMTM